MKTPTDILPDIRIPVIAVVWQYQGLPADDMAGRIIYYYERTLTSTVNDIEHIESQSLHGVGVVKIFFQPGVDIRTATAQVTSISQTVLKQMPPGITPPLILNYNASTCRSSSSAFRARACRSRSCSTSARTSSARAGDRAGRGDAVALRRQGAADPDRPQPDALQAKGLSAEDVETRSAAQNLIMPAGTAKIGAFEYDVELNDSRRAVDELNDLPIKTVNGATIYMRDVAHVRDGFAAADQRGARGRPPVGADDGAEERVGLDPGDRRRRQSMLPKLEQTLPPSLKVRCSATSRSSSRRRSPA